MRGRLLVVVVLTVSLVVAVGVENPGASSGRIDCGVERWTVKTLQDRPILIPAQPTTIAYLTSRPAPASPPDTRLPFGRTMITESPAPTCDSRAFPVRRAQIAAARRALRVCSRARVTGVAFFDFEHGQTGVAPNAIELHPILGFRCLNGGAPARGAGGSTPAHAGGSSGSPRIPLVQVTSPVSAGSEASVTVAVSPAQTCSITVNYKSGPSQSAGLDPQRGTRITWTWTVGTNTTPGRWPILVSCARSGSIQTSFVVT
jgi:hypothetical protein